MWYNMYIYWVVQHRDHIVLLDSELGLARRQHPTTFWVAKSQLSNQSIVHNYIAPLDHELRGPYLLHVALNLGPPSRKDIDG